MIEVFARVANLEVEEAEQLLAVGETLGLDPEVLMCLGAMAPRVVEIQRRFILDGIISRSGELIPV